MELRIVNGNRFVVFIIGFLKLKSPVPPLKFRKQFIIAIAKRIQEACHQKCEEADVIDNFVIIVYEI